MLNDRQRNLLKTLIRRLSNGESLESVRKDFAKNFSGVSAEDIADAEQKLIDAGTPPEEVQQLCDVHSAALHEQAESVEIDIESVEDGHPSKTLHVENVALEKVLNELEEKLSANDAENFCKDFPKLLGLYAHYGKKEFLFMPLLANHGVTGPSQVMWGVDDEIKKSVRAFVKNLTAENFADKKDKLADLLTEIREMIFKEEKIFIPLTFRFFTGEDFLSIYRDSLEMQVAFIEEMPRWKFGDEKLAEKKSFALSGKIKLPTGDLTLKQLQGIFKLLPVDVTFIDQDDKIKFFINGGKVFDRPLLALGNDIYSCHPPQIIPVVRKMLTDFKNKKRDCMEVCRTIKGKPVSVSYFAVHDDNGNYLGAVEFVQDFTKALEKFAK